LLRTLNSWVLVEILSPYREQWVSTESPESRPEILNIALIPCSEPWSPSI
jgi:hypothetical protein